MSKTTEEAIISSMIRLIKINERMQFNTADMQDKMDSTVRICRVGRMGEK